MNDEPLVPGDPLRDRLASALKAAADGGEPRAESILRLVLAAIDERDHCARQHGASHGIDQDEILVMLEEMVAQRQAEISRCESGLLLDEAEQEAEEIAILRRFLPKPMSEDELAAAVDQSLGRLGATRLRELGPVLSDLKQRYEGPVDVVRAKELICAKLR